LKICIVGSSRESNIKYPNVCEISGFITIIGRCSSTDLPEFIEWFGEHQNWYCYNCTTAGRHETYKNVECLSEISTLCFDHTHKHAQTHTQTHTHKLSQTHTKTHKNTDTNTHTNTHIYIYIYVCVCVLQNTILNSSGVYWLLRCLMVIEFSLCVVCFLIMFPEYINIRNMLRIK